MDMVKRFFVSLLVAIMLVGAGQAVQISPAAAATVVYQAGDTVQVSTYYANVRSAASSKGKILAAIKRGTVLQVESRKGNWYLVNVNGKQGYIYVTCLKKGAENVTLTVSAAASVTDAMNEIIAIYQSQHPQIKIVPNYGASGSLMQQIEQGAPADIFLSAAKDKMDGLESKSLLIPGTRTNLLGNEIVLVCPENSSLDGYAALTDATVKNISIGDPSSVPAGKYAKELLTNMGLWAGVEGKLVLAKDVRQVLSYVETGNVDAGIIYKSDLKVTDKVELVAVADKSKHTPIIYPAAVISDSKHPVQAKAFLSFLESEPAMKIFMKYGFTAAE